MVKYKNYEIDGDKQGWSLKITTPVDMNRHNAKNNERSVVKYYSNLMQVLNKIIELEVDAHSAEVQDIKDTLLRCKKELAELIAQVNIPVRVEPETFCIEPKRKKIKKTVSGVVYGG